MNPNYPRFPAFTLISLALCLLLPVAAQAGDAGGLTPESASMDAAATTDGQLPTPSSDATILYGSVKKRQTLLNANDNAADLQSEKAANGDQDVHALAVKKLANREELSAEEYRSLGVGCVGFEVYRTFFQKTGKVIAVYRDSPAEKAGIQVGDLVVSDGKDEEAKAHPEVPLWQIQFAQAGTKVDVTILRDELPLTITLVRMNIEDIQESKIRRMWERVIRNLGYPKEGTFVGRDLKNLQVSPNTDMGKL